MARTKKKSPGIENNNAVDNEFEALKHDASVSLEKMQELEKRVRACTQELPNEINYDFHDSSLVYLTMKFNRITVMADSARGFEVSCKKNELDRAKKILEILQEWAWK